MFKKFIKWLTRPKITIFLKSGNYDRYRKFPDIDEEEDVIDYRFAKAKAKDKKNYDLILPCRIEIISIRKWYQPWA